MSDIVTGAIRDIPRNCICAWSWVPAMTRHIRWLADPDCPWHICGRVPGPPEVTR